MCMLRTAEHNRGGFLNKMKNVKFLYFVIVFGAIINQKPWSFLNQILIYTHFK